MSSTQHGSVRQAVTGGNVVDVVLRVLKEVTDELNLITDPIKIKGAIGMVLLLLHH